MLHRRPHQAQVWPSLGWRLAKGRDSRGAIAAAVASALCVPSGALAQIVPADDGTGTIVGPETGANLTTITGGQVSGGNLFHSFEEFGVAAGEAAVFATTPAIENVLGRAIGGSPSFIDGTIGVIGSQADLYLINPAGVVFGSSASLNVPGDFTVTSADAIGFGDAWWSATSGVANWNALTGDPSGFAFRPIEPGTIVNAGSLAVSPGHSFSAIGGTIASTGTIAAPAGTVTALAVPGESLVRLSIPGNVLSLDVAPIVSPATDLPLAASLPELLTGNVSLQQASQLSVNADGSVSLSSTPEVGIAIEPGTVLLSGAIDVANEISPDLGTAQQATILGDSIAVMDATIDASGVAGGGTVLVGGEFQGNGVLPNADVLYVNSGSQVLSDAIGSGDGGTAILWADGVTIANGTISARGENGGFVEVSGKQTLSFDGAVDVRGTTGADGTVLFDPDDLSVGGGGDPGGGDPGGGSYVGDPGGGDPGGGDPGYGGDPGGSYDSGDGGDSSASYGGDPGYGGGNSESGGYGDPGFGGSDPGAGGYGDPGYGGSPGSGGDGSDTSGGIPSGGGAGYGDPGSVPPSGDGGDGNLGDGDPGGAPPSGEGYGNSTPIASDFLPDGYGGNTNPLESEPGVPNDPGLSAYGNDPIASNLPPGGDSSDPNLPGGYGVPGVPTIPPGGYGGDPSQTGGYGDGGGGDPNLTGGYSPGDPDDPNLSPGGYGGDPSLPGGEGGNSGPIAFDFDDPTVPFGDRVSGLDTTDPDAIAQLENSIRDLPLEERRDAQQQLDDRVDALEAEAQTDPNAAVARFIRNQDSGNQLEIDSSLSEITNEQLDRVSGNVVFLAEDSLTVDRPVVRSGAIAFEAGESLTVNAPVVASGPAADIFLSAGDDIAINANITSTGSGDITIIADDAGIPADSGRRNFSPTGVSITQAPGTVINAGSGDVSIVLEGSAVNSITLGNVTTSGAISVSASGGNIRRLDNTSVIRANTGSFTTSGIGQIGEPNNPLTVDIAQLTSQVAPDLLFINDLNRSSLADNAGQFSRDLPDTEADTDTDSGSEFELDEGFDDEFDSGDDTADGDSERDDSDGEDGDFDEFNDLDPIPDGVFADLDLEVAALEQDRLQEFGRFLGRNLSDTTMSAASAREALQAVAEQTGNQSAAIYVTLLPDRLDLLVFSSNDEPIRQSVEVGRDEVIEAVADLRYAISNPRARLRGSQRHLEIGQQFHDWLIAPIADELAANEIDTLVFSMPAGLRGLPVAALYNGDRFLVEDYSLGLIPSLALVDMRYRPLADTEVLAMGASEFSSLASLPAVPLELETIANSLWDGTTLLNESFTRENIVRSRARNPYPILHLATHGEFGSGENGSFIQLWDEQLKLDEIRELGWNDPPVELLVLSACRTAVGDAEAELGFAGFAVAAGVKSALASLWYVSDVGTMTLMAQFYHHLSEADIKAEALREAQMALIRNDYELLETGEIYFPSLDRSFPLPEGARASEIRNLSHPYYWSAFTMIGSPW